MEKKIKDLSGFVKTNAIVCKDNERLAEYKARKKKDKLIRDLENKISLLELRIIKLEEVLGGNNNNNNS